jgi:hypothetical protein
MKGNHVHIFKNYHTHFPEEPEIGDRGRGIGYGGIGAMHLLVRKLGLAEAIDRRLHLLQIHLPYHESDHVLNFASNALCDGTCL